MSEKSGFYFLTESSSKAERVQNEKDNLKWAHLKYVMYHKRHIPAGMQDPNVNKAVATYNRIPWGKRTNGCYISEVNG